MINEDGDVIITEAEFLEIKRLQDLKKSYQDDFDELKHLRSEVHYCEKLVSQCRQRLVQGQYDVTLLYMYTAIHVY